MSNSFKPTGKHLDTLIEYANKVGPKWKDQLLQDWARAGTRVHGVEYAHLQKLRNHCGPSWLDTYELPAQD